MPRILTDEVIQGLLQERKVIPKDWRRRLRAKELVETTFFRKRLEIIGEKEHKFIISVRNNQLNTFDFSIILTFEDADGEQYNLVRFNGKHPSQHTNKWEKRKRQENVSFRNIFHKHIATERYQTEGFDIDGLPK